MEKLFNRKLWGVVLVSPLVLITIGTIGVAVYKEPAILLALGLLVTFIFGMILLVD